MRWTWILLSFVAPAALLGCHRDESAKKASPTPVRVRVVAEATGGGATRYSGSVEPAAKVDLAFKVGGYVRELAQVKAAGGARKVQEGDWVTKGTVLAVVNQADYAQKIDAAKASLAEASASVKQAELDYQRAKTLLEGNAISKADYDGQLAKRDVAVAREQAARAQLGQAQLSYEDCTLRAPFDGVVIKRTVEVGTLAAAGTLAFTIADTRTVKFVFGAPDSLLGRLHIGDKLSVEMESLGKSVDAEITRIAPSADSKSRTFDVEASVANADGNIKVGMIVSIDLKAPDAARTTLALPLTAIVRAPKDPRGFAVFVVEAKPEEAAHLRTVKLGDIVGNSVIVTAGLAPGERVVETGATFVSDGEPVRVVR